MGIFFTDTGVGHRPRNGQHADNLQRKVVVDEPSIVALDVRAKLVAIGQQARQMHEKTNPNIKTIRPLKDGVIADFNATELMLRGMIKKVKTSGSSSHPRCAW